MPEVATELNPQLLIIDLIGGGYSVDCITVALHVQAVGLLQYLIVDSWPSYEREC